MALSRNNKSSKSDKSDKTFKRIENGSNGADSRAKNLDLALGQIEKQFGKGSIMKLGEAPRVSVDTIPTGSIGLDIALGIGGLPRGRIVEMFGPESSGKSTLSLHVVAQAQKQGGIAAFIDAEHALDVAYARNLGVNVDELLVSQPDTGEQGLEIADMLVRSGGVDLIVVDSVAALVPKAEIEGEMGDTHVGLQARLMSQALRKLAGNVSRSNTMIIFINQLREKIGVMFGCFSYETQVTLADGTQEQIGKIVSEKMPVEVLSYNFESGKVEPKKVINWFNNGGTDEFLHFTVLKPSKDGKAQFGATANHRIRTPGGWKEAKDLKVGERVLIATEQRLSEFQWEVIRGGLMGDSAVSQETPSYRMGHGAKPAGYLDWKVSLFGNIPMSRMTDEKGDNFVDLAPLAELADLGEEVYSQVREKNFSWNYLKRLSPLSLAIWYMNDGHLDIRSDWETSTRIRIPVQAMTPEARERVVSYLRDTWGLDVNLRNVKGKAMLVFDGVAAENFQELIAGYVHESMQDKLLPKYRERFNVTPVFKEMERGLEPSPIVDIHTKPLSGQQGRYDLEVEGSHNYFVDGVLVHNSPETTPGGRALKFYSSVRLDIRKIQNLKEGDEVVGSRVRVKVVKSKVSAPFRQTEFDIYYGMGVSKEGSLVDLAVDYAVMDKSGSWYMYDGDQIGQGRENAKAFLSEHPNIYSDIEKKVKEASGLLPIQLEEQAPSENGAEPVEAGKKD